MDLENRFTIPIGVDQAWSVLLDAQRVARCIPGATLEKVDEAGAMTGRVAVKLGPMTVSYAGRAEFTSVDHEQRQLTLEAVGREPKGSGRVRSTLRLSVSGDASSTACEVDTSLDVTGRAAQFGAGMLRDVSATLIDQFAQSLTAEIQRPDSAADLWQDTPSPRPGTSSDAASLLSLLGPAVAKRAALAAAAASVILTAVLLVRSFRSRAASGTRTARWPRS